MLIPINQIAHDIGMQNQYLYGYVHDGSIKGQTVPPGHDYHSDNALIELESLLAWIHTRYPDYWRKDRYENAVKVVEQRLAEK